MIRKLATVATISLTVFALTGCGESSSPASETSASIAGGGETVTSGLGSVEEVATAAMEGDWVDAGTITKETVLTDPAIVSVNTFMEQIVDGGTLSVITKVDGGENQITASMKGDSYYAKASVDGGAYFAAGNGTQWCSTDVLQSGTPALEDWTCRTGKPEGGNEFEQIAGYGWLAMEPSAILSEGSYLTPPSAEGKVESNGTATRVTYAMDEGNMTVTYSPSGGWVYAEAANGDTIAYLYDTNVPEFPALPELAADSTFDSTASAAPVAE